MRLLILLLISSFCAFTLADSKKGKRVQEICETVKFPGGDTAFLTFVYSNLDSKILNNYPDLKGTVYIGFIVDTSGKIISTEIKANRLNIPDSTKIIKEIRRVLLTSPNWDFFDLVKGDYDDEYRIDEIIVDDNLPVDDTNITIKSYEIGNQKCKKQKVKLIYPFKFPIPKLYLEHKK